MTISSGATLHTCLGAPPERSHMSCALVLCLLIVVLGMLAPAGAYADDAETRPYKIHVEQAVRDDRNGRLARTRWPNEIDDAGWDYGVPLAYQRELVEYWRGEKKLGTEETALKRLPGCGDQR